MADSNTEEDQNKPVTGYPSQAGQVATGYPRSSLAVDETYFYVHPPPSPHFPAIYHPRWRRHHDDPDHSSFLCRLTAVALSVFLLTAAIFSITWLLLRPLLPSFSLTSASFSPLLSSVSGVVGGGTWNLSIQVTNPNTKLNILFDRLQTAVFYGDEFLMSRTELPPFDLGKGNQTLLDARLALVGANDIAPDVLKAIRDEQRNGFVSYGIRVLGLVRFGSGGWSTRKHLMRVFCYGVEITYNSGGGPGTLLNPWKECKVEI